MNQGSWSSLDKSENNTHERERTDFIVNTTLQVAHVHPTLLLLHLRVVVQNLVSEPRQIIHPQLVLFSCRGRVKEMMLKTVAQLRKNINQEVHLIW